MSEGGRTVFPINLTEGGCRIGVPVVGGKSVLHKSGSVLVCRPPGCHKGQDLLDEIVRNCLWVSVQGEDDAGDQLAVVAAAAAEVLVEAVHDGAGASWHRQEELADEVCVVGGSRAVPAVPPAPWVTDGGSNQDGHVQRLPVDAARRGAGKLQLGSVGTSKEGDPGQ